MTKNGFPCVLCSRFLLFCWLCLFSGCARHYAGYYDSGSKVCPHFLVLKENGVFYYKGFHIINFCFLKGHWRVQKDTLYIEKLRFLYGTDSDLSDLTEYSELAPQRARTVLKIKAGTYMGTMQDSKSEPFYPEKFKVYAHDSVPATFSPQDSTYSFAGKVEQITILHDTCNIADLRIPPDKQDFARITFLWDESLSIGTVSIFRPDSTKWDSTWKGRISRRKIRIPDDRLYNGVYKKKRKMMYFGGEPAYMR